MQSRICNRFTHKREKAIKTQSKIWSSSHKRRWEERKGRKKSGHKPQTIKKMATGAYILIILLNANGLNALTKRHRLIIDKENQTHIYAVYKKPSLDLGTYTD